MKNVDLSKIHYLSGPFHIEGAAPGDLLLVEIMDVQPFQDRPWGFCGIFDKANGGGFLDEIYPSAAKAIWDFEGIYATSRHIPGVKFAGLIHPGILGCAPSQEVLDEWNRREGGLVAASPLKDRDVAHLPLPKNAHAGGATSEEVREKVAKEGARTVPGRPEHGGNCDIKNLSRGSKVYLPVHVDGAKFSVGDLHFSQGDGEISFCGAIEMAGVITINFKVIKQGVEKMGLKSPIYIPGPVEPNYGPGRHIYFEGFSVDEHGKQRTFSLTHLLPFFPNPLSWFELTCSLLHRLHGRNSRLPPNRPPLHRIPSPLRLLRLPDLPFAFVRAHPGPRGGHRRRAQRLHHARPADGYL